ncbi:MAG: ATPase domain-containing protein [Candidatus Woesearchaeota archaeon]
MGILETGIPELDEILGGGLETGSSTVFWTKPGIDDRPFAYYLLQKQLARGNNGIFVVQTKKAETVETEIVEHGYDITAFKRIGNFVFIDAYSKLVHATSKEKFIVGNPNSASQITNVLATVLKEIGQKNIMVIFGSLSMMVNNYLDEYIQESKVWKQLFQQHTAAGVFLFTHWPYSNAILKKVRQSADYIVEIGKQDARQYFVVQKKRNGKAEPKEVPINLERG